MGKEQSIPHDAAEYMAAMLSTMNMLRETLGYTGWQMERYKAALEHIASELEKSPSHNGWSAEALTTAREALDHD